MLRLTRLALSLSCPFMVMATQLGWGRHWWIAVPCLALGAGSFALGLYDRQMAGADDPATLGLRS